MKRILAILLALQVLLSVWAPGGMAEFFRIPALCDHYQQHFRESGDTMSWPEFLTLHFTDPDHEHKDANRHTGLPFHHSVISAPVFIPPTLAVKVSSPVARIHTHAPRHDAEVGEWSGRSVFHPPKTIG